MRLSKIFYSLVVAGLLAFGNVAHAAVHDFGSFGSNFGVITSVKATSWIGLSGLTHIDYGTAFGQGAGNRLSQDDRVSWNVSGLPLGSSLTNMYVHVQGIDGGYSAKHTPVVTAVPEHGTYAMLLVGLGLIGFSARHRKSEAFDD